MALFWGLLLPVHVTAQKGFVTYEEVVKMTIELPPEMMHAKDMIPDSRTTKRVLRFSDTASLLTTVREEGEEETIRNSLPDGGEVVLKVQSEGVENVTYFDFETSTRIQQRGFMGRTFLINGALSTIPWRLTEERSEFLGYMCQKAIAHVDSTSYEAWFTPEIGIPSGPGEGGLPGLILVMNVNDGEQSYVAQEVVLEDVDELLFTPPSKGKKVSQEEFDAIVAEKIKEMEAESSGQDIVFRIHRRN